MGEKNKRNNKDKNTKTPKQESFLSKKYNEYKNIGLYLILVNTLFTCIYFFIFDTFSFLLSVGFFILLLILSLIYLLFKKINLIYFIKKIPKFFSEWYIEFFYNKIESIFDSQIFKYLYTITSVLLIILLIVIHINIVLVLFYSFFIFLPIISKIIDNYKKSVNISTPLSLETRNMYQNEETKKDLEENIEKIDTNKIDIGDKKTNKLSLSENIIFVIIPAIVILILAIYVKINGEYIYIESTTKPIILPFLGIFVFFYIASIYFLSKKIDKYRIIIVLPFTFLILGFFIFLFLGMIFGNITFFINDFLKIINPYLMTYGFLLYGSLLGYYISEDKEKDKINLFSWMIVVYLILLLFTYFYSIYLKGNSESYYIESSSYSGCLEKNKEIINGTGESFMYYPEIEEYVNNNEGLKKFREVLSGYNLNTYYINPIYYKYGIDCINNKKIGIDELSGIIDIGIYGKNYKNISSAYSGMSSEIQKYYKVKYNEFIKSQDTISRKNIIKTKK